MRATFPFPQFGRRLPRRSAPMWVWLGVLASLVNGRADWRRRASQGLRRFRMSSTSDNQGLARAVKKAARQYQAGANKATSARAPHLHSCWQDSASCREWVHHPAVLGAARALVGEDVDLSVITMRYISRPAMNKQRIHRDMNLISKECAGNGSVSVWLLIGRKGLQNSTDSPLGIVSNTHSTDETPDDVMWRDLHCWTWPGAYKEGSKGKVSHDGKCPKRLPSDLDVVEAARTRHGQLDVLPGPTRTFDGVAWLGHTWHFVDDKYAREALFVTYATQQCAVSSRKPSRKLDFRRHWTTGDHIPRYVIPSDNLNARQLSTHAPRALSEDVFLNRDGENGAVCQAIADPPDATSAAPSASAARPPFGVYDVATAGPDGVDMAVARAYFERGTSAAPHTGSADETCVVVDGAGSVAVADLSNKDACPAGSRNSFSIFDARAGTVLVLPAGVPRAWLGDAGRICVRMPSKTEQLSGASFRFVKAALHHSDRLFEASHATASSLHSFADPKPVTSKMERMRIFGCQAQEDADRVLGYARLSTSVYTLAANATVTLTADKDSLLIPVVGAVTVRPGDASLDRDQRLASPVGVAFVPPGASYKLHAVDGRPADVAILGFSLH